MSRLLDLRIRPHPPSWTSALVAAPLHIDFFTHHFIGTIAPWSLLAGSASSDPANSGIPRSLVDAKSRYERCSGSRQSEPASPKRSRWCQLSPGHSWMVHRTRSPAAALPSCPLTKPVPLPEPAPVCSRRDRALGSNQGLERPLEPRTREFFEASVPIPRGRASPSPAGTLHKREMRRFPRGQPDCLPQHHGAGDRTPFARANRSRK